MLWDIISWKLPLYAWTLFRGNIGHRSNIFLLGMQSTISNASFKLTNCPQISGLKRKSQWRGLRTNLCISLLDASVLITESNGGLIAIGYKTHKPVCWLLSLGWKYLEFYSGWRKDKWAVFKHIVIQYTSWFVWWLILFSEIEQYI